jgi:radical SAM superfamily enzyme YgiQ (UPF0313 family)
LATIAACLEQEGHEVAVLDCTAEQFSISKVDEWLGAMPEQPDCVGITATCATFQAAIDVAVTSRRHFPSALIVLGGVHPTVDPQETLTHPEVDIVVLGEGERTMVEIAGGKQRDEINGIAFMRNGEVIRTPARELIKDLDALPFPAYHLLPMDKYHPAVGSFKSLPAMSLFATRGCPGRCIFCHRQFGGKLRTRSARHIIDEIKLLYDVYGIREIAFYDDTFTVFDREVREFCRILIEEGPKIDWSCFTRVDRVNEELLMLMKKAGCHLILFGVESSDREILKTIKKAISLDDAKRTVALARKVGIRTRASFMFGNPGETPQTVKATIEFSKELDPDQVQYNLTTAYPGTELYEWAKKHGYLATDKTGGWSMSDYNLNLPTISRTDLEEAYRRAHAEFYVRPRIILRRLFAVRSWPQLKQEMIGALAVVGARWLKR